MKQPLLLTYYTMATTQRQDDKMMNTILIVLGIILVLLLIFYAASGNFRFFGSPSDSQIDTIIITGSSTSGNLEDDMIDDVGNGDINTGTIDIGASGRVNIDR